MEIVYVQLTLYETINTLEHKLFHVIYIELKDLINNFVLLNFYVLQSTK